MSPDRRRHTRAPANIRPTFQRRGDGRAWVAGFLLPEETADLIEQANEAQGDGDVYDFMIYDLLPLAARLRIDGPAAEDELTDPAR